VRLISFILGTGVVKGQRKSSSCRPIYFYLALTVNTAYLIFEYQEESMIVLIFGVKIADDRQEFKAHRCEPDCRE